MDEKNLLDDIKSEINNVTNNTNDLDVKLDRIIQLLERLVKR